jgi:hypothetical protein
MSGFDLGFGDLRIVGFIEGFGPGSHFERQQDQILIS